MAEFSSTTISKLWKTTLRVQNGYPGNVYHPHVSAPGYYTYSNIYGNVGNSPFFGFGNSINCTASAFGYASFYTYYGTNNGSPLKSIVTAGVNLRATGSYESYNVYAAALNSYTSKRYWIAKYNYPNSSTSAPVGLYGTRTVSNVTITHVMFTGYDTNTCIVSKIVTPTNKTYYIVTPMYCSASELCRNVDIYGYGDHILGLTYAGSSDVSNSEYRTDLDINLSDVVSGTGIYNALNSLKLPSHMDNTSTASTIKSNADTLWNWINQAYGSSWSSYSQAEAKYNAIVAGHAATVTRDLRLTKKADKTELNTSNNKLAFNQIAVHNTGMSDYNSIKSTLSSVNNKLK